MNNLSVHLIQTDLFWEQAEKNRRQFAEQIAAISAPVDLIVLPEMFTTGFSMQAESLAETMDGKTVEWMREQALKSGSAITGSFICKADGHFYNRLIFMHPDGHFDTYDKRHLFSMGDEHKHYSAGSKLLRVQYKGWTICPLVCYDLRFPVWSRNTSSDPYDLLIYVANWPERRSFPWSSLLVARAIENQCYVVGVNRIGLDGNSVEHAGNSVALDPKGAALSAISPHTIAGETVVLDAKALADFRTQFPVLADADRFQFGN